MAQRSTARSGAGHPGRSLLAILVIVVIAGGWMVWKDVYTPRLGLDLQGGTTVTLIPEVVEGEPGSITDDSINQAVEIISARVNGAGVSEAEVAAQGRGENAVIVVSVPGLTEDDLVEQLGQTARLGFRPVIAAQPNTPAVPQPTETTDPGSGQGGGQGGQGTGQGSGQGTGQNDKNTNDESASNSGGSNGALVPRLANGDNNGSNDNGGAGASPTPSATDVQPTDSPTTDPTAPAGQPPQELQQKFQQLDCSDPDQASVGETYRDNEYAIACDRNGTEKFLLGPVAVPGTNVDTASANLDPQSVGWIVTLDFNGDGTKTFGEITAQMAAQPQDSPGNRFAIVLDGVVVSAPGVNEAIPGGQAQISGQFTKEQAQDLANVLKFGALPLTFDIGERQTISATLGDEQLQAGLLAGAIGLVLVVVYLLLYYRALGLVAVASLVLAGGLTYALVVFLGEQLNLTLTLAGVAGLIVAIGITADSFIVYFERIRDEVREGRSIRAALEAGWVRARRTIIAADFISLIAAAVLWVLSVGGVRGFAFTLGLTTIIDLLVVFLFTKPMIAVLARTKFFSSGHPLSGLSPDRLGRRASPLGEPRPRRAKKQLGKPSSSDEAFGEGA